MGSVTIVLGSSEDMLTDMFGPAASKGSVASGLNGQTTLQLVEYEESRGFGFE